MINDSRRQRIRRRLVYASLALFPVTFFYFSPVIIVFAASKGIVNGSFLVFAAMFALAPFAGRAFCGWACPGAGIQEACAHVRGRALGSGRADMIKYIFVWAPWIAAIVFFAIRAGGYSRVDPLYMTWHGISVVNLQGLIPFLCVVVLIAGLALALGRRAFCRYGCWMAPFMVLGVKLRDLLRLPGLRMEADPSACTDCGACVKNCPMSLEVNSLLKQGGIYHSECILCGTCADSCPKKVLRFTMRRAGSKSALKQ